MESKKPLILVTNDDGITAKGIFSLQEAMLEFGDVVVVAPDSPQSGMGHAITINEPLRLKKGNFFESAEAYACSGTPVDCVKLGIYEVLHRTPDLIVSGVNHGANTSTNVLYSGTMSAAVEGAMEGIPSIGFSLYDYAADADFTNAIEVVKKVVAKVLEKGMPKNVCLNVNIPDLPIGEVKGIEVCKQAHAFWDDRFDKRKDPFNNDYYWLTGDFVLQDTTKDTDLYWIEKGYATIVPTQFDMTAHKAMNEIENWKI
ncbi:MAG TPA: 5'/3'-nucleotidase SurE [Crocinitomicaceae bacterium]|nr:5'/3'-nucleotidase SurE [Crocinitomicaceae bacterium]